MARAKRRSCAARWDEAVSEAHSALGDLEAAMTIIESALETLQGIQEEFSEWKDNLPENLSSSALGEDLEAVCELDFDSPREKSIDEIGELIGEAKSIDLPMGFRRD